tara:strand:+ start:572 stop:1129 length:558 start_codon:yes stop_codon:yes gene_type:complete
LPQTKINKAIFIDRDGVINEDYGYVYKIIDFKFCLGTIEALTLLQKSGYLLIIITNQSGIDRGLYSQKDYELLTSYYLRVLSSKGIFVTATYHCPHHPLFSKEPFNDCDCRKPKPGMFLKASKDFDISLKDSIAIGDKTRDLQAAFAAGIEKRILISKDQSPNSIDFNLTSSVFPSLLEFAIQIK